MGKRALYIIDLDYPIPLVRPYSSLRENKTITLKESQLRSIIRESLKEILNIISVPLKSGRS